jgi:hypothetical protein
MTLNFYETVSSLLKILKYMDWDLASNNISDKGVSSKIKAFNSSIVRLVKKFANKEDEKEDYTDLIQRLLSLNLSTLDVLRLYARQAIIYELIKLRR